MRDLDGVVSADIEARERRLGAGAPAGVLEGVLGRVRRNRARRHAVQGVAAAVVVAVLGTAGWWGLGRPAPQPGLTPSPTTLTPTPTVTSTPTATVTSTPTQEATSGLPYPNAPRLTEAVLRESGTGWALLTYGPAYLADESGGDAPSPIEQVSDTPGSAVYVTDPDGALYQVTATPPAEYIQVYRWTPGSSWAFAARTVAGTNDYRIGRLDLLTGRFDDLWVVPGWDEEGWGIYPEFVGTAADGSAVFQDRTDVQAPWSLVVLSPSGERRELAIGADPDSVDPSGDRVVGSASSASADLTLTVVELGDGTTRSYPQPRSGGWCRYVAWFDADDLLVACGPFAGGEPDPTEMWLVPVGEGAGSPVLQGTVPAGISIGWGDWVRDGTVVFGTISSVGGLYRWDGHESRELLPRAEYLARQVLRAAGRAVVLVPTPEFVPEAGDKWGWATLTTIDIDTGASTALAPPVASMDDRPWSLQVMSWAFG